MLFDFLDAACAETLRVDVNVFIEKIEKTTEMRRRIIIEAILDDDNKEKVEQARRCFNMIK